MGNATANLPAQTSTSSTGNMPVASLRERSSADLTQAIHSEGDEGYVADRTRVILKLYYDPEMSEHDRAEMIESYVRVLGKVPKWAVAKAFNKWEIDGTRRPAPAELYGIAIGEVGRIARELTDRQRPQEAEIIDRTFDEKAAAETVLIQSGFTAKRFGAVKGRRMAGSDDELYADERNGRIPHWTERPATDAAMVELARVRAADPMISAARRAAKDEVVT